MHAYPRANSAPSVARLALPHSTEGPRMGTRRRRAEAALVRLIVRPSVGGRNNLSKQNLFITDGYTYQGVYRFEASLGLFE